MSVSDAGEIPEVLDGQQTQSILEPTQSCRFLSSFSSYLMCWFPDFLTLSRSIIRERKLSLAQPHWSVH